MVTNQKFYSGPLMRYRLGNALIILGVMAWLPFIVLRIAGEKPSLFLYLPFHLLGILAGSRLRSSARKEMGTFPAKKSPLQILGRGMIVLGILVWAQYFYLKVVRQSVEAMDYLPYHLIGLLGGITLLAINYLISRKNGGLA